MTQAEDTEVTTGTQDYVQLGVPGVPYSAIRIHISDDRDATAEAIKRGIGIAKYVRDEFVRVFGALPEPSAPAPANTSGAPKCNVHNRAMKPSAKGGGFYCSAKLGDGTYCQERAA